MRMEDQDILPGDVIEVGMYTGKTVTRVELDPGTNIIWYKVGGQWITRGNLMTSLSPNAQELLRYTMQEDFVTAEWQEKKARRMKL